MDWSKNYYVNFFNKFILRNEVKLAAEKKEKADQLLIEGKRAQIEMKENLVKLSEADKAMEKNFKKEFPGLNYSQLEGLIKAFK